MAGRPGHRLGQHAALGVVDAGREIARLAGRRSEGGADQGLGSAIGVFLYVLVLPAMYFNIRRLRNERKEGR